MSTTVRYAVALLFSISAPTFSKSTEAKATEKQTLFAYVTVHLAKQRCGNIDFNLDAEGWILIGLNMKLNPAFAETWGANAYNLVDAAAQVPTFCEDVKKAYGPKAIPVKTLPWATPEFRGMIK